MEFHIKKIVNILSSILLLFALAVVGIYLFLIRPIAEKESRLKPIMLNAANELMKCSLESKIIEGCYTKFTSQAFQVLLVMGLLVSVEAALKLNMSTMLN